MIQSVKSPTGAMFLKKLFDMMHTTPSNIGGWCQGGTAFEIKNPKEFARVMLPQYFKHSKFSSFVRQLNFYGFQKCKKEVLLVAQETEETRKALTFFHPYFIQHKPNLMSKIKRKTNYTELGGSDTHSNVDEVEELRSEVTEIKSTLVSLSTQLAHLTEMVSRVANSSRPPMPIQQHPGLQKRNSLIEALAYLEDVPPPIQRHELTNSSQIMTTDSSRHMLNPLHIKNESDSIVYQC